MWFAGSNAGFSGRNGSGSSGAVCVDGARIPLSVYFAQRKAVVNSGASFRIFCAAVALLQVSGSNFSFLSKCLTLLPGSW